MTRPWAAIAVTLVIAAACGGGGPSDNELRQAVDAHLASTPKCIGDPQWVFPVQVHLPNRNMDPVSAAAMDRLDALARLGLVRAAPITSEYLGAGKRFELTSEGKESYRLFPPGAWQALKSVGAFCYGHAEVASVVRHSEPADLLGQVATEVTYTYWLRDTAGWVQDPELRRLFPHVEPELGSRSSPREARITLVKMSDGWRAAGAR